MTLFLIFFFAIAFKLAIWYQYKFKKNLKKTINSFIDFEKTLNMRVLYITNFMFVSFLFEKLNEHIVDIDNENKTNDLIKKMHKIKGNLLLIIDINKTDEQKIIPMIKVLEAYSKVNGNNIITYIPYKSKDFSSLLSLVGKKIIFGNYATFSCNNLNQTYLKTLELFPQYSSNSLKKIYDNFNKSTSENQTLSHLYTFEELANLKIQCVTEDREPMEFKTKLKEIIQSFELLVS